MECVYAGIQTATQGLSPKKCKQTATTSTAQILTVALMTVINKSWCQCIHSCHHLTTTATTTVLRPPGLCL